MLVSGVFVVVLVGRVEADGADEGGGLLGAEILLRKAVAAAAILLGSKKVVCLCFRVS